jgi:putative salt-induced outer membrane protein YdiY
MARRRLGSLAFAIAALSASAVFAQSASPAPAGPVETAITLESGDVIRGVIKKSEKDAVILTHPVLGELRLLRAKISQAVPELPPPPPPPPPSVEVNAVDHLKALQAAEAAKIAAAAPKPASPAPVTPEKLSLWAGLTRDDEKSFWIGWQRTAEFGMNTSSGNSDNFSTRAVVNLRRATKKMATSVDGSYNYARNNSGEIRNRGEVRARNDFNMSETNWQFWGAGGLEVDKKTPWEARLSLSTGPAYTFIKDQNTTLVGRVGVGGYRDIDGGNNDIVANGVASLDLFHKLSERASFYANAEIYPDMADIEHGRSVSRAGLTYLLDPESRTTLKVGAEHRFTTDSGPRDASDVDMFVTLGFSF